MRSARDFGRRRLFEMGIEEIFEDGTHWPLGLVAASGHRGPTVVMAP